MAAETQPAINNLEQLAKAGNWDELGKQAIAKTLSWVEAGEKFVSEQAPLVVKEVILWGWVKAAIAAVLFAAICGTIYYFLKWAQGKVKESDLGGDDQSLAYGVMWFGRIVVALIGIIGISHSLYQIAYIWCAPRLYLIETLRDMCKTTGQH